MRWSDGSTSATRTDTNFTQNVTFTAYFEQNEPAPSYTASASQDGNGVITFTLNAEGQTVDISMELVQTATGKSYSLGKIGSFGSGSYRFDPACPGDRANIRSGSTIRTDGCLHLFMLYIKHSRRNLT